MEYMQVKDETKNNKNGTNRIEFLQIKNEKFLPMIISSDL